MLSYYYKNKKNNLSLFIIKTKKLSSLDITLYIKTGSVYENIDNNGISHLLEHLIFLKTKNLNNNSLALNIYPYTNKDFTYYEITTHKDLLDKALLSLFKVIRKPEFSQKNLKIIKNIVKEEILEMYHDPESIFHQKIDSYLYQKNSLALSIGGNLKTIENISLSDLKNWYRKNYQASRAILTIAGDVNVKEITKKINGKFLLNNNKLVDNDDYKIKYPKNTKKLIKFKGNIKPLKPHLAFVFPTVGINHKNYLDFVLLAEILNRQIRQEFENSGFLYEVNFFYQNNLKNGEYRLIINCQKKNLKLIIEKFNYFLLNYRLSINNFSKTKDYLIYQFLLKQDNVCDLSSLSLYLLAKNKKILTLDDEINYLKNIDYKIIKKLKADYFNKNNCYYFSMD